MPGIFGIARRRQRRPWRIEQQGKLTLGDQPDRTPTTSTNPVDAIRFFRNSIDPFEAELNWCDQYCTWLKGTPHRAPYRRLTFTNSVDRRRGGLAAHGLMHRC